MTMLYEKYYIVGRHAGHSFSPFATFVAMSIVPEVLPAGFRIDRYEVLSAFEDRCALVVNYRARDERLDVPVLLQELLPAGCLIRDADQSLRPRGTEVVEALAMEMAAFRERARSLAGIHHAGVSRVRDLIERNGTLYLVLDEPQGPTLAEVLRSGQALAPDDCLAMLRGLCAALGAVHAAGSVHGALRPETVVLAEGRFDAPCLSHRLPRAMHALGGARNADLGAFDPLELYATTPSASAASDVYALCALAYRCITGETPQAANDRVIADGLRPLTPAHDLPYTARFLAAVNRGLGLRAEERLGDIRALAESLDPVVQGAAQPQVQVLPAPALPDLPPPAKPAPVRKPAPHPLWVALLALAVGGFALLLKADDLRTERTLQALVIFPLGAMFGALWGWRRWPEAGTRWQRVRWTLGIYLTITLLSVLGYLAIGAARDLAAQPYLLSLATARHAGELILLSPSALLLMVMDSPTAFALFAALFAATCAWSGRLPALLRRPANARWANALSVAGAAGFVALFALTYVNQFREAMPQRVTQELRRAGLLLDATPEQTAAAIRKLQAEHGIAQDGEPSARILDLSRAAKTRWLYTVRPDGSGDFDKLAAAAAHASSVLAGSADVLKSRGAGNAEPLITLLIAPGRYTEEVKVAGPVLLKGESPARPPELIAPSNASTLVLTTDSAFGQAPSLENLRVFGDAAAPAIALQDANGRSRIERVDVQSEASQCGMTLQGAGKPDGPATVVYTARFRGGCGLLVFNGARADLSELQFVSLRSTAVEIRDAATASMRKNVLRPTAGAGLVLSGDARLTVDATEFAGSSPTHALISVMDRAALTLRDARISSPQMVCLWLRKGAASASVERTRFTLCGGGGHVPIRAEAGTTLTLGQVGFSRTGPGADWRGNVVADSGATTRYQSVGIDE